MQIEVSLLLDAFVLVLEIVEETPVWQ